MTMRAAAWAGTVLSVTLGFVGAASAQGTGGVASSGMGQGEASISTRSDVRIGIESGPGTSGQRLADMARAVSSALGTIRECYGRLAAEDPTIVGEMQLTVSLPRGRGRVQLEMGRDTVDNRDLARCVRRAVERADYGAVSRPASVRVKLELGNSAAAGAEEVARRREEGSRVELTRDADGNLQASGGVPSNEVRFTLTAPAETGAEVLAAMQRAIRANVAGLLDCRRRAGRREMNPEGRIDFRLTVPRRGRARLRNVSSTVQDSRAPACVSRVLSRTRFDAAAAGSAQLRIHFAPRQALDVPVRE